MHHLRRFARDLRNEATDAEQHLWRQLRHRNLSGNRFRRQHLIAGYIVDFACVPAHLAIELDGGQHLDALAYDTKRTRAIEAEGYKVLRFWNHEVFLHTDDVLAEIARHLECGER